MLPLSGRSTFRLSINTLDSELLSSPHPLITLLFLCRPESFPSLFYHIYLNPGFFIVGAVYHSINRDEIITT